MVDPLVAVARDLYGAPPSGFVAARTAAARTARQAGDRALATAIGALRRPSTAAAAVNLLVRERSEDVGALLDLGVRLREAQAALAGADLRALHAEQQRAMAEVVPVAADLVADGGPGVGTPVRAQVEATLRAAMGDPDAAAAVATGLLVRDLFSSGFEPVDVTGAVAVAEAPPLAGAPARRTPMRVVAEPAPAPGPDDHPAPGPGRRRGRLITEEPEGAGRPTAALSGSARGGGAASAPAAEAEAGRAATRRAGTRGATRLRAEAERAGSSRAESGPAEARRAEGRRQDARRAEAERQEARRAEARAAARRAADADLALARAEADERRRTLDEADARQRAAETRAEELAAEVRRATEEVARWRAALAEAERDARTTGLEVRHARSARTAAARAAERAESRLRAAEQARSDLGEDRPRPAPGPAV